MTEHICLYLIDKLMPLYRSAVGYVRVSTPQQEVEGDSLPHQADRLRAFCRERDMPMQNLHEDTGSAFSSTSGIRPGLRQAVHQARADGAPLVVTRIDRLSRNPADIEAYGLDKIVVISIEEGHVDGARLRLLITRAHERSLEKSSATRKHADAQKKAGRKLGNTKNLGEAQAAGANANVARKDVKTSRILEYVARHAGFLDLPLKEQVMTLNSAGVWNLKSRSKDHSKPWTYGTWQKFARVVRAAMNEQISEDASQSLVCGGAESAELDLSLAASGVVLGKVSDAVSDPAPSTARGPVPPKSSSTGMRRFTEAEIREIDDVLVRRKMKPGAMMLEMGLSRLDPSVGIARARGTQVKIETADAVVKWLKAQRGGAS